MYVHTPIVISQQRSQCEKKDVIMEEMRIAFDKQLNSRQLEVCMYICVCDLCTYIQSKLKLHVYITYNMNKHLRTARHM